MVLRWIVTLTGFVVWIGIAWLLSEDRKRFPVRLVLVGLALQGLIAWVLLKVPVIRAGIEAFNQGLQQVLGWARIGALFVLGSEWEKSPSFLVNVIPTIILVSVLSGLLYWLGVLPAIVLFFSRLLMRVMKVSGVEAVVSLSNIFLGQTEAGLVIRPYLKSLSRAEILTLMTAGMATIAGGVYVIYLSMGIDGAHLLTASVISAPAALMMARILRPQQIDSAFGQRPPTLEQLFSGSFLQVLVESAQSGALLALNVTLMLLVFTALLHGLDQTFQAVTQWVLPQPLSFSQLIGYLHAPLTFFWDLPSQDLIKASQLLGKRIVFNEFISYQELSQLKDQLQPETKVVLTYALCGFANGVSMGIQVGGLSALCPQRRADFVQSSWRAMVGGLLASYLTASWAKLLWLLGVVS